MILICRPQTMCRKNNGRKTQTECEILTCMLSFEDEIVVIGIDADRFQAIGCFHMQVSYWVYFPKHKQSQLTTLLFETLYFSKKG